MLESNAQGQMFRLNKTEEMVYRRLETYKTWWVGNYDGMIRQYKAALSLIEKGILVRDESALPAWAKEDGEKFGFKVIGVRRINKNKEAMNG